MAKEDTIIKKAAAYLSETFDRPEIFVFGSFSNGKFTEYSDLDMALFLEDYDKYSLKDFARILFYIQNHISSRIELHFFPKKNEPLTFSEHIKNTGKKVA
jgi:predicted nucleotidyltransferase